MKPLVNHKPESQDISNPWTACFQCPVHLFHIEMTGAARWAIWLRPGSCVWISRLRTVCIKEFQQKCDADADENKRPNPMCVDPDHTHSREQEHDPPIRDSGLVIPQWKVRFLSHPIRSSMIRVNSFVENPNLSA